ncbi:electron transfer flavoprotein subunit beta/FixA family protein [Schaalia sp. lx-260]|uniref:electron transfer flavoprotein subunit beta/FixA family protein n=1 Tax=Schaalia sp. lx-260 TaxID=2899082 RepID=UPI001E39EA5B|nr:electron transfer flavoprotein subunit beta/FixA family protein [Schaalia sp. lx-260]MCD4549397.1 electron transfer flavoprotein subunit beta/FixA family protein [Schaalia sp. lx-260]
MRIVVCVKHVPDVQSDRRFEDARLVRGEDDVLNELDENAIEAAVSMVEEHGGEVIALTMGPADAEDALMRALQMGADRGILVTDNSLEGSDVNTTAALLAAAITKIAQDSPVDMVVTGMASLDAMTSMLPAALAAHMRMPFLGLAHTVTVQGEAPWNITIERSTDEYDDVLSAHTPLVLSVTDQANTPRYPAFAAMKAARNKPMDEWSFADLSEEFQRLHPASSLTSILVDEAYKRERQGNGTVITDSGDAGERLAEYLLEKVK